MNLVTLTLLLLLHWSCNFSTCENLRDSTRAFRRTISTKYYLGFVFVIRMVKVDGVSIQLNDN